MPQRRDGVPVLLRPGAAGVRLSRVPLGQRGLLEDAVQALLFEHPLVLPVEDFDEAYGPLVPVGREIPTEVGPIDNLYVSPSGEITVVEAKLWRNPQARREVVGQIVDYAKELARWSYEDLDRVCHAQRRVSLWNLVSASGPGTVDETVFCDAVAANLRSGKFLLLVVGDGIREEVERMADYLQATPQLRFTFGLVELRYYRGEDGLTVVVPSTVARTVEITRAVVEVVQVTGQPVQVTVTVPGAGGSVDADVFFEKLSGVVKDQRDVAVVRRFLDDVSRRPSLYVRWASKSFVVKLRPSSGGRDLTIVVVWANNGGGFEPGWLRQQLDKSGLDSEIGIRFVSDLAAIAGATVNPRLPDSWVKRGSLSMLASVYDQVLARIDRFVDEIETALMPAE